MTVDDLPASAVPDTPATTSVEGGDHVLSALRDIAAGGARIRFLEVGSGEPVLLLHDYLEDRHAWDELLPRLSSRFRLIVPDLPGFGESEKPSPSRYAYGPYAFAESMVALLAGLPGVSRISVCGHGLGASIALALAARHADIVDKLVLVAPLFFVEPPDDPVTRLASAPFIGPVFYKQVMGRRAFLRHFERRTHAPLSPAVRVRVDRLYATFDTPAGREAAYATMLAEADPRALHALLPRVVAPTLIACGRNDEAFPIAEGRRLVRKLARGRLEGFACGRSPAEEQPEAFAEAVAGFLKGGVEP